MAEYEVTASIPLDQIDMSGVLKPIKVYTDNQILNWLEKRLDDGVLVLEKVNGVVYLKEAVGTGLGQTLREAVKFQLRREENA